MAKDLQSKKLNAIVFAGAGASKSVNADQYPTTVEFFDRLPQVIRAAPLFKMAEAFLKREDGQRILDIEEILWELQSLQTFIRSVQEQNTLSGYALNRNRLATTLLGPGHNFAHLDSTVAKASADLDTLVGSINSAVYEFYDYEPTEKELSNNWLHLLSAMRTAGWDADIFTTNYDVAIETAILLDGATPYERFVGIQNGPRRRLDLKRWLESDSRDKLLTKLHGSIDWQYRGPDIFVGSPVYTGDHKKQAIIYPGFKGEADAEFFRIMHEYLARRLEEADVCVFIGFAFRDEYVNRLIRERLKPSCRLVILNPAKTLSLPRERSHFHVKRPFDKEAIDRVING